MQIKDIVGSGKGGGGHTPTEAPNTLQSDSIISVLEVLSEGEIEGLVNGRQSIYFDGTPLENPDGSKNYDVESDYRYGLPDQAYMSGWPSAESLIDKNLSIKIGVDAIHTATDINVDAIKLIVSLPNGISKQESNGDLNGASVNFTVYTADASGVYQHYQGLDITGKTTSAFFRTYRVERPIGSSGIWSVKVVRNTPDAENTQIRNDIILAQVVEIKDVKLQFNDTAYIGLKVSAKSVSNKIPVRSYHVKGVKIQVPNNYDPITATYTGQWDGTFVTAWSDNPAWILYDLLTNDRYGCGQWIKAEDIDVYSFYDAAVYNDELVPNGKGGLERRFTFNGLLNNQDDAIKTLSMLAGSFNSVLLQDGRLYRVQQDRPSSPVAILTNANVIDGAFVYAGTPHQSRHTVVNVTYQDKTNKYKEQIATVEAAPSELERYNGVNQINIKAIGAVTESQAMRAGNWHIETELNQKETCKFAMSFNGFELRVGDVVKIADRNIKTVENSGRILDVVTDTGIKLTLDRPVTYAANDVFSFINSNNQITEFVLTNSNSNALEITLPTGIDLPKIGGAFSFESIVTDRQFKITGYSQTDKHVIEFTAIEHDPNKYARVEQGLDIPASIYSSSIFKRIVNAPTDIKFGVNAYVNDEAIRRDLTVSWAQSVNTSVNYYNVAWRVNNGNWTNARAESAYYDITNIGEGVYDVKVTASGLDGTVSAALTGTYTHNLVGGTGSPLNPVTNLVVKGTTFDGKNLDIQFSNPSSNVTDLAILKDFRIDINDLSDNIVRTDYVGRVVAGAIQYYTYSYDSNQYDFGEAKRNINVTVYCRDTDNKLSIGTTQTFSNPVPAAPQVTVKPGVKSLMIETNRSYDKDYAGTVIYASQTSGFTPSPTNKIYQGINTFYIHESISGTWYYRVAHYDTFDGGYLSGLNHSAEVSGIPATAGGIPTGSTLPVTPIGTEYSYYLDTNTSDKGLYGWDGTKWIKVSNLSDLTNATGKISTTQINDNAITTPKIETNSITSGLIVAGAVTADKLTVNNLSAISANMGAITSGSITLDSAGYIRGGATSYSVGTGIWQGYDNGAYKWRVGTPGSSRAEYNGTAFNIYDASGNLTISSGVVDYSKISGKPSSLSNINTTEANKLSGIAAGATVGADGTNLNIGLGTNLLPNTEFLNNNFAPVVIGWNPGGVNPIGLRADDAWRPKGGQALEMYQANRSGNQYNIGADVYINGPYAAPLTGIPVIPGKRYEFSSKLASHRCDAMLAIVYFDTNNTTIQEFNTGWVTRNSGGQSFATWTHACAFGIAPANAAYACVYWRKSDTDINETNSYAWLSQPHFGEALANQTVPSTYSPGTSYAALTANWSDVSGSAKPLDNSGKVIDLGNGSNPGQHSANDPPSYYPVGKTLQFKLASALGLSGVSGYVTVEVNKHFADNTAGTFTQWAYTTTGQTYKRTGYPTNSTWATNWVQDLDRNAYTGDLNATYGANSNTLSVGVGANLLYNAGLNLSNDGWLGYPNAQRNKASYNIAQGGSRYGTFTLNEIGQTGGGAMYIDGANKVPVTPGQRYELSAYTGAHRCRVAIDVDFWDWQGNYLGGGNNRVAVNAGENNEEMPGGISLSSYKRIGMFVIAPANAATARFICWKNETKAGKYDSWLLACLPFFGVAGAGQTELSPWSEGSAAINTQITSNNVSTYISNAAIGSAQIGSIALVGTNNFSVKSGYSGERMEMDAQVIKIFDANGTKRIQLGNLDV